MIRHFIDGRIRNIGSGRPTILSKDPPLTNDLLDILVGSTRGGPEKILFLTLKSTRNISDALVEIGHIISHVKVSNLLKDLGYILQSNRKLEEGSQHADRDPQFKFIEITCIKALGWWSEKAARPRRVGGQDCSAGDHGDFDSYLRSGFCGLFLRF
jgi:hypothetical protein